MTEATKNLVWFDQMLEECSVRRIIAGENVKSILNVDNQAVRDFVHSPIQNHRSKHIDIFFVRDLGYKETFDLTFVRNKLNLSEVFTNFLTKHNLNNFIECIFNVRN